MSLEAPLPTTMPHQADNFATPASQAPSTLSNLSSCPPSATASASLRPSSANILPFRTNQLLSPSDVVGPSPVNSNGTAVTEIEDDAADDLQSPHQRDLTQHSENLVLSTMLADKVRHKGPEEVDSVIHAPESFRSWASDESVMRQTQSSDALSPEIPTVTLLSLAGSLGGTCQAAPLAQMDIKPAHSSPKGTTSQAQDSQNLTTTENENSHLRPSSASSLEKIEEQTEAEGNDGDAHSDGEHRLFSRSRLRQRHSEVDRLNLLLSTAWTCCLELGSYNCQCRRRDAGSGADSDQHVFAWQACWKLCEHLYNDETSGKDTLNVHEGLNLCRKFCHALFELRTKEDETVDSILRVNFDLTKHVQDQMKLPEGFRERTLEFYVTLCYRLMKKRHEINDENDMILEACWALTEVLLSMRQNRRDGQKPDENLLVAAIEATYNINDLFRRVLSAARPGRQNTQPRWRQRQGSSRSLYHSQSPEEQRGRESRSSKSNGSGRWWKREGSSSKSSCEAERRRKEAAEAASGAATMAGVPETPVTEIEDTPVSAGSQSPTVANTNMSRMMVVGRGSGESVMGGGGWSSSASNMSRVSHTSHRTSSTARIRTERRRGRGCGVEGQEEGDDRVRV